MRLSPANLMLIAVLVTGCGGQPPKTAATPKSATPSADQPADTSATLDASKLPDEPVPPFYGKTITGNVVEALPGPLGQGIWEATGDASIGVGKEDSQTSLAAHFPVKLHLEARESSRGREILASIGTIEPKSAGGVLYLTTSTGGGGDIPPVPAEFVSVRQTDDGIWHYGATHPTQALGLLNMKDMLAKATTPSAEQFKDELMVDQFEGMIDGGNNLLIVGIATLPDGRRVVLTAKSTEPPQVIKATPTEATPPATETPAKAP
ncbi:MAG: hypothetical protein ABI743_03320 [bacterium]